MTRPSCLHVPPYALRMAGKSNLAPRLFDDLSEAISAGEQWERDCAPFGGAYIRNAAGATVWSAPTDLRWKRDDGRDDSPRVIVDGGHPVIMTLREFLADNADGIGPEEAQDIAFALARGDIYTGGGGAAASFTVQAAPSRSPSINSAKGVA